MASIPAYQMKPGFYWYFEPKKEPTVVLVSEDGVQFAGNDELYQVASGGISSQDALRGKFVGPMVAPAQ